MVHVPVASCREKAQFQEPCVQEGRRERGSKERRRGKGREGEREGGGGGRWRRRGEQWREEAWGNGVIWICYCNIVLKSHTYTLLIREIMAPLWGWRGSIGTSFQPQFCFPKSLKYQADILKVLFPGVWNNRKSSKYMYTKHWFLVNSANTISIRCWKVAGALHSPKGIALNSYKPEWVMKAVFSLATGSIVTCQ